MQNMAVRVVERDSQMNVSRLYSCRQQSTAFSHGAVHCMSCSRVVLVFVALYNTIFLTQHDCSPKGKQRTDSSAYIKLTIVHLQQTLPALLLG